MTSFTYILDGILSTSSGTPAATVPGTILVPSNGPLTSGYTVSFYPVANPTPALPAPQGSFTATVTVGANISNTLEKVFASVTFYALRPVGTSSAYVPVSETTITASIRSAGSPNSITSSTSVASSNTDPTTTVSSTTAATDSASTSVSQAPLVTPSGASNNHYGTGALVGAAVGCAVGGLLLGSLIAFLLFRIRRRNRHDGPGGHAKESSPLNGHGEAVYLNSKPKAAWSSHLPQSDSDSTIRAAASRTLDQIEMHIENFYTDRQTEQLSVDTQSALEDFDSPHLPDSILTLIPTSNKPTLLLKHCLTNLILSRINFDSGATVRSSFLPKDLIASQFSSEKMATPGYMPALLQWRALSRHLRRDPEEDESYLAERDQKIEAVAQEVCYAFDPWATSDEHTRLRNLIAIIKRASELGLLLYPQLSVFEWQWQRSGKANGASTRQGVAQIVVLPGLYKMTDGKGAPLTSPLHLLEPRMGSLDG